MLKQIPRVLLLVTLLTAFVASSAPAFSKGSTTCECYTPVCIFGKCKKPTGSCKLDTSIPGPFQCVSQNCSTYCVEYIQ